MKEYPFPAYEYAFNKPVIFMFPINHINAVGIYWGLEDQEKIAMVTLKENGLDQEVYKIAQFDGYMELAYPQQDTNSLFFTAGMSIGVIDLLNGKQTVQYSPKLPNYDIKAEYGAGKQITKNGNLTISLFYPFVTDTNTFILCQSIVLEDLSEKKTIKRLQVRNNNTPFISFFSGVTIYRDGLVNTKFLEWKAINDLLEPAEHPLVLELNEFNKIFNIGQFQASESQECAIVSGHFQVEGGKTNHNNMLVVIPWEKDRSPIPILLPDNQRPSQYISKETFLLSPSGKWLFFVAAKPGLPTQGPEHYYLMYIDKTLPNYYLPPIKIETGGDDFKVTWMQEPEGFVLHDGKHLRYWDLSKFEPGKFTGK